MRYRKQHGGFITLFFILGVSFAFLTWTSMTSMRVFDYISIHRDFISARSQVHEMALCADAFVDNVIESKYEIPASSQVKFARNLYFSDSSTCTIANIRSEKVDESLQTLFFTSGDFGFEYRFEKGFVAHIKSFNLF